jgi:hypothetical protein
MIQYNILIEFRIPMNLVRFIKMCLNETYSKIHVCKHSSDSFPIQDGLKQGDVLSRLLFNFSLEYAIKKVQKNHVRLKLNGTHQLLAYVDDVNLLGGNITTVKKKNTETLIDASEEVVVEIDIAKSKHMLLSRHRNAGQNWNVRITNRSFEIVSQFKYLGMTVINQNLIQEKIERRLNSGNACYNSVQNLLSFCLLSKNIKIIIYKIIIMPVVLYGCETWSLTLRVFENRVLRRIFGLKRD